MKNISHTSSAPQRMLPLVLEDIEDAQLVRRGTEGNVEFIFKHALVQDGAYTSLTRNERKRLHGLVAGVLERIHAPALDENAALLAYHFERADEPAQALAYLQRAAEWARHGGAHHEEIALLTRAIDLAEQHGEFAPRTDLYARRGRALTTVTRWQAAREDLELALALLPEHDNAGRAEVLTLLAIARQWLLDLDESRRLGEQALALAEPTGRMDLVANALSALAMTETINGQVLASVAHFDQVFARAGSLRSSSLAQGMELAGLARYWLGHYPQAIERNRQAMEVAREVGDSVALMRGMSNLGMALSAYGEYTEAFEVFARARSFGREHKLGAWLARQIAIEGGLHLELFDYAEAQALALQAQDLARASNFIVAMVSPGVDLLFNYARTGHFIHAAVVEQQVRQAMPGVRGAHVWLLDMRFMQARAELAAARYEWEQALALADQSLALSRQYGRIKYEALGLQTRARVLMNLGRAAEALANANAAVELARPTGDPAMFVRAALARLEIKRDDALVAQTRDAAHRISHALPNDALRTRFQAYVAESV